MKLDDHLDLFRNASFCWSTNNCCHFVGRWVLSCEGEDPLVGLSMPESDFKAARLIASLGSFEDEVSRRLRRTPLPTPKLAHRGDLVFVRIGATHGALGICNGINAAYLARTIGLWFESMSSATTAWSVRQA